MSLSPGVQGPLHFAFGAPHLGFLQAYQDLFLMHADWTSCGFRHQVLRQIQGLSDLQGARWSDRFHRAIVSWTVPGTAGPFSWAAPAAIFLPGTPPWSAHATLFSIGRRPWSRPPPSTICFIDVKLEPFFCAYLLDQCLSYARARLESPETGDSDVLNWFGQGLDRLMEGNAGSEGGRSERG